MRTKHKSLRQHEPIRKVGRKSSTRLLVIAFCSTLVCVLIVSQRSKSPNQAQHLADYPKSVTSFAELLSRTRGERQQFDIARVNLLCAQDLNGAENLNLQEALASLDAWAQRVQAETQRHLYRFKANPAEFNRSEGYFRMLILLTVLQQDCGVRYNPARMTTPEHPEPDSVFFADSRDLFLHGILAPEHQGTCVSMPVLYAAVGRRLGYPLKLVTAKGHLFIRWDGEERFNIEGTNEGLNCFPDEYYQAWPYPLTAPEIQGGHYLKSLTVEEELGLFLSTRGQCLFHNGRVDEAREAFATAARLASHWPEHKMMLARTEALVPNEPQQASTLALSEKERVRLDALAARADDINRKNREMVAARTKEQAKIAESAKNFRSQTGR